MTKIMTGLLAANAIVFALLFSSGEARAASAWQETEATIFGKPDWRPPAAWQPPPVNGRDFWPALRFPATDHYDEYGEFVSGDEWNRFAIFRENAAVIQGNTLAFIRRRAPGSQAPVLSLGLRYATGDTFVPETERPAIDPGLVEARRKGEWGMPEAAIDGRLDTWWSGPKLFPQWLLLELDQPLRIDRLRFIPYVPEKPTYRFFVEVSPDGKTWKTVADLRDNTRPIGDEKGLDLAFAPETVRLVRFTFLRLSTVSHAIKEIEAYDGAKKIAFARASAECAYYEDFFLPFPDKKAALAALGESFLGFRFDEWDNDLGHLESFWKGKKDALAGRFGPLDPKFHQYVPLRPKSRPEYLAFLRKDYENILRQHGGKLVVMPSWTPWLPSYVCEWGGKMAMFEFHLAGPANYSFQMDLLRGGARQYGVPFAVYLTTYNGGDGTRVRRTTKSPIPPGYTKPWEDDNPHNGTSLEFHRRWLWFLYLSGATLVDFGESPDFYDRTPDGKQKLADIGRVQVEWFEQVRKHSERGARATPVALACDYAHLLPMGFDDGKGIDGEEQTAVDAIRYTGFYSGITRKEQIDYRFICVDEARGSRYRPEDGALRNKAHGEIFDGILLNAPSGAGERALAGYRAAVLVGRIDPTPKLREALVGFLKEGGIVVAQTRHLDSIPEPYRAIKVLRTIDSAEDAHDDMTGREYVMAPFLGSVLKGNVKGAYRVDLVERAADTRVLVRDRVNRPLVLWSPAGKGGVVWLLAESPGAEFLPFARDVIVRIGESALPFQIRGDIQRVINKTPSGWLVGLFNNRGAYKTDPYQEAEVDVREASAVEVELQGGRIRKASEWITDARIKTEKAGGSSRFSVVVPAGDVRILQLDVD